MQYSNFALTIHKFILFNHHPVYDKTEGGQLLKRVASYPKSAY
jgi:hypothetical protein